ncbi:MAG TPA: gamma-glutamyl-gamma-aminobutyrate hydrolase family protein [Nitrospiria bacterium]|nr:gamma-glutamyl-gamma-aminobutyrate hydrolase family protein [Nitrospiria bacterium]
MSEILALQHVRCETLGTIAEVLRQENISIRTVRIFESQPVPHSLETSSGLIVMGGPMGVYEQDRYPFLRQEIRLMEEALRDDKPILGVCLGSQLLASALGAVVAEGPTKEIGWYRVTLTPEGKTDPVWTALDPSFTAYHWHGDVFDLPSGAVSLASSERTPHQAFRHGRSSYGVLFHMEVTEQIIEDMVKTFQDELPASGLNGRRILQQAGKHLPRLNALGRAVFARWAGLLKERAQV